MDNVKVKICGITNAADASAAVELGANALGFIFADSPRQMTPQKVRTIVRMIPPFVKTVGVFVNETATTIRDVRQYCGLDLVQLHGDESPAFCDELMPYVIKSLRIKDDSCLQTSRAYQGKVRALLLDTWAREKVGGTGKTFDWQLAIKIKEIGIPIILAGGLRPSNINSAIQTVNPYAVDINSGIEEYPGKKNPALMKAVMEAR
ncbi:MAG: phosphoribosylanthranilate isomerase [Desulfobacterales bacterium]|nr:phosphoribosylanthranilate isomerase [Desulfobacterales bacterium]